MNYEEIMESQATINIGIIGHVAHGKSTLVNAISGVKTVRFKSELEKNITIKLGYANTKIYKCDSKECLRPGCYQSFKSSAKSKIGCKREGCNGNLKLVKHISFVDCPGHDVLMATMINGTAIMDSAILMIAANESCPQPQTQEHLFALERTDLSKILVVQNKIDLMSRERCLEHLDKIKEFLGVTKAKDSPIIPVSGQYKLNVDAVLDFIVNYIPMTNRDPYLDPRMVIIRSFDINKPGYKIEMLKGGVVGGSLLCGKVKIGDIIEIRPGDITKENGRFVCRPYISKIVSLKTENNSLEEAYPGGLIGIGTELDPSCCIADVLVGQIMGARGKLPDIYTQIEVEYEIFGESIYTKTSCNKKTSLICPKEVILLNIGSCSLTAVVTNVELSTATFELSKPVCLDIGEKIAISRKTSGNWRLSGYGKIKHGKKTEPIYDNELLDLEDLKDILLDVE